MFSVLLLRNLLLGEDNILSNREMHVNYREVKEKTEEIATREDLIIETSLSVKGTIANTSLKFKCGTSSTLYGLLSIQNNKVLDSTGKNEIAALSAGEWCKLGIKLSPTSQTYSVYVYDDTTGAWSSEVAYTGTVEFPTDTAVLGFRFNITKSVEGNIGNSLLLDDIAIYKGSEFKDVSDME